MKIALKDSSRYITMTYEFDVEGIGTVKYNKWVFTDNVLIDRTIYVPFNQMTHQEEEDLMDAFDKVIG